MEDLSLPADAGLELGPRSVTALIEHQDGQWLAPEPYQNELTNINTPDQWRHFLAGELHP